MIDAIDGMSINTDSVVVKARGNYFYVNILDDNGIAIMESIVIC